MKMIVAVVRTTSLEHIVKALEKFGVRGMTISKIKGIGEQVGINNPYTVHDRIEIIVPDDKAGEVARIVFEEARTGLAGDGLVAVLPVEFMTKIRTGEKIHDGNYQKM